MSAEPPGTIAEPRVQLFAAREAHTPEGTGGDDGLAMIEKARAEGGHLPSVRWFLDCIDRFLEDEVVDGRNRSLPAYLRLPSTASKRRLHLRNVWLARAAAHIDAEAPWQGCRLLADEWETFCTRGGWLATRSHKHPPIELRCGLRRALWYVCRYHGDAPPLLARALYAIPRVVSVWG